VGRWPDKYVIGLTGNIATGKSIVRKMLEHLGAFCLDADGLAHQAMTPGAPAFKPVVETFGRWILGSDGRINRATLAKIVFNDADALVRLEQITHPIVRQAVDILLQRAKPNVAVIEAIKLLEAGYGDDADALWVVDAPPDVVLKRLTSNRKMSEAAARMYIQAQPPQERKLERADVVINNAGSLEETWKQVQSAWNKLPIIAGKPPTAAPTMRIGEVRITRGRPSNAQAIAASVSKFRNVQITKMDVMMAFGEKAYLLAEANAQIVGVAGMQVENLITRVDEFYILPAAPPAPVVQGLIQAVEENSTALESEIALFFLDADASDATVRAFAAAGYQHRALDEIKVPAWREAARESQPPNTHIFAKKLRAERVLKPL
jgi:dephospho-CoA kinase